MNIFRSGSEARTQKGRTNIELNFPTAMTEKGKCVALREKKVTVEKKEEWNRLLVERDGRGYGGDNKIEKKLDRGCFSQRPGIYESTATKTPENGLS